VLSRMSLLAALLALSLGLAACGGGGDEGGARTLNWYIAKQPGGAVEKIAQDCSQQSNGQYRIEVRLLPTTADAQREQLVRRLGAEDESIDLIGLDVIWTGEFANAKWLDPVPDDVTGPGSSQVFQSALETARFEDRLYGVPIWSNTQLLWYRKDKVARAPETWDQMIDEAVRDKTTIQVQANRYEGLVVWANTMIESAGTQILRSPTEIQLEEEPTKRALEVMGRFANSPAAPPNIDTSEEGPGALVFESGASNFMLNYPFVFASAKANAPDVHKNMGAAKFPKIDANKESKPPLGGINLGVSAFSSKKDRAWEAVRCLISAENQLTVVELEGLPPVREDLYEDPKVQKAYPGFADLIRQSIRDAAPRPASAPAYQDLSLGLQSAFHPVRSIDPNNVDAKYDELRDIVEKAIKREGLL
jgi:multiple sugar transport system substrate-binding protein